MRLLADESCDFRVVRALRRVGHDVTAIIELAPGADDLQVIEFAAKSGVFSSPKIETLDNWSMRREDPPLASS
jgi:hypothetical protein